MPRTYGEEKGNRFQEYIWYMQHFYLVFYMLIFSFKKIS